MTSLLRYCVGEFNGKNNEQKLEVRDLIFSIPNLITLTGIILTLFLFYQIARNFLVWLIPFNIVAIGLSDLLDGFAATKLKQHSWLGKFIDGFRDRLLGGAILFSFLYLNQSIITIILVSALVFQELYVAYLNYTAMCKFKTCSVHTASKVRQLIHIICGLTLVIQQYWLGTELVELNFLLVLMIVGSFGTMMCTGGNKEVKYEM